MILQDPFAVVVLSVLLPCCHYIFKNIYLLPENDKMKRFLGTELLDSD